MHQVQSRAIEGMIDHCTAEAKPVGAKGTAVVVKGIAEPIHQIPTLLCGPDAYLADNPYTLVCSKQVKHRLEQLQLRPCILVLILLQARTSVSWLLLVISSQRPRVTFLTSVCINLQETMIRSTV